MKAAKEMTLVFHDRARREIGVTVSLDGFTAAYASAFEGAGG